MRKLFGITLALSFSGALLLGGVYAWDSTSTLSATEPVGNAAHTVQMENVIGPNGLIIPLGPNGHEVVPARGTIDNKGLFPLSITSGSISITRVQRFSDFYLTPDPAGTCSITDFQGRVIVTDPSPVAPGAVKGGGFDAAIKINETAPSNCQYDFVDFDVEITASTLP